MAYELTSFGRKLIRRRDNKNKAETKNFCSTGACSMIGTGQSGHGHASRHSVERDTANCWLVNLGLLDSHVLQQRGTVKSLAVM